MIKEPRLRFTEEERADPALEKPIRKAEKAAAKAEKATDQAEKAIEELPKKRKLRREPIPAGSSSFMCDLKFFTGWARNSITG